MLSSDADRWNLRYLDDPKASFEQPRELLISHQNIIPKNGLALDLAMETEGILFIECLTEKICDFHPEVNSDYLLKPGELRNIFSTSKIGRHIEILYSFEGWHSTGTSHPRPLADLIARRIV